MVDKMPPPPHFATRPIEQSPMERLSAAALSVLKAKARLAVAQAEKTAALVAIHEGGCPKRQVSGRARKFLREYGFTEAEIALLGLSPGSVRLVLDPARTPQPENPSERP
jgi:hypothetical protein